MTGGIDLSRDGRKKLCEIMTEYPARKSSHGLAIQGYKKERAEGTEEKIHMSTFRAGLQRADRKNKPHKKHPECQNVRLKETC